MKKTVLKPWVQNSLMVITMLLGMVICMIDDIMNATGAIVIIAMMAVFAVNFTILKKYGRWEE